MNLALVSENLTEQGKQAIAYLISQIETKGEVLCVAYFASEPDPERFFFEQIKTFYASIGVNLVHYIEIEDNYDEEFVKVSLSSSLIHLSGGDTYRFLYWLKKRGLDLVLRNRALGGLPIVGISAGAMILTPSIDSAPLCGDVNAVDLKDTSALGLVPFLFAPHAEKSAQETAEASAIVNGKGQKLALCSDNDALVITGTEMIEFGTPLWI